MVPQRDVFIAPGSVEHLKSEGELHRRLLEGKFSTVLGRIPFKELSETLAPDDLKALRTVFRDSGIRFWGTRNAASWRRAKRGDIVLFFANGIYHYSAEIVYKAVNEALARRVWGNDEFGETWKYIIFLENLRRLNWGQGEFNSTSGYSVTFRPQGFMRVMNPGRSSAIQEMIDRETSSQ